MISDAVEVGLAIKDKWPTKCPTKFSAIRTQYFIYLFKKNIQNIFYFSSNIKKGYDFFFD